MEESSEDIEIPNDDNRSGSSHDHGDGLYNGTDSTSDNDDKGSESGQVVDSEGEGAHDGSESDNELCNAIDNEQEHTNDYESSDTPNYHVHSTDSHFNPALYNTPDAVAPLYEGASISVLQAVSHHLDWFTAHPGTSKEALSDILHLQHHCILPSDNLLPGNYKDAMKIVQPFLIKPITFDACINDCIVYRNKYSTSLTCPYCQAPRYKYATTPAKKFAYLPIRPRLERLFGTASLSQLIQAHNNPKSEMSDIQDSPVWKEAYSSNGIFNGDLRGIGLSLCTDGVNPFSHLRVTYSMWPIMMTLLNMPRKLRNAFGNIMLLGIIPGSGKKEPALLSPYLEIVVDELLQLSNSSTYDAYVGAPFQMKVELLLYVLDYPGVCKVFNVSGSGAYKGCMWCDIKGMTALIF